MTLKNPLSGSIRKLLSREQPLYRAHLLRLDTDARHRRFAHAVSDDFIVHYAQRAAEPGSIIFGYFTDGQLRAVAELKMTPAVPARLRKPRSRLSGTMSAKALRRN